MYTLATAFLGTQELIILFLILVLIFGAAKLPQLGRGLGEGIRNFRKGLKSDSDQIEEGSQDSKS